MSLGLFQLSRFVVVPILADWLVLRDIAVLSVAVGRKSLEYEGLRNLLTEYSYHFSSKWFDENLKLNSRMKLFLWCQQFGLDCGMVKSSLPKSKKCDLLYQYVSSMKFLEINGASSYKTSCYPLLIKCHASYLYVRSDLINRLCHECIFLNELKLMNCDLSIKSLLSISVLSVHLKYLGFILCELRHLKSEVLAMHCHARSIELDDHQLDIRIWLPYIGSKVTELHLSRIACLEWCPNLTFLHLVHNVQDDINMIPHLSKLKTLEISCGHISIESILMFSKVWPTLSKLIFSCFVTVRVDAIKSICNNLKEVTTLKFEILHNNDCLYHISLIDKLTELDVTSNYLSDYAYQIFAKNCSQLKHFYSQQSNITNQTMVYFGKYSKKLEILIVLNCFVDEIGASTVIEHCPALKYLKFSQKNSTRSGIFKGEPISM